MAWGGKEEQRAEIEAGDFNAKNWYKEAEHILEATVCFIIILG
jgi:hypothetical protein